MDNLKSLFEDNIEELKTCLIFDMGNLAYRNLYISHFELMKNKTSYETGITNEKFSEDDSFNYWRHLMFNSLFYSIKILKPNKVLLAFDSPHNWRKEIYPDYKGNRKDKDQTINWEKFYKILDEFYIDIKRIFTNINILKIPQVESDDIIAIISTKLSEENYKIIIISTDHDFLQLQQYKNISQWNPIEKIEIKSLNPIVDLNLKILCGDRGDWIPNIKKDSMLEKDKLGPVGAQKMINAGLDNILKDEKLARNYKRNLQLIDFSQIPKNIEDIILKEFNEYQYVPLNGKNVVEFFTIKRLNKMYELWQTFSNSVKNLS